MKVIGLTTLFVLSLAINSLAQTCKEYTTPNSAFAFCPPAGWTVKQDPVKISATFESPAVKTKIGGTLVADQDFVPIPRETFAYRLIAGELQADGFTNVRLMMARDSATMSGLKGSKLVFFMDENKIPFVQIFYVFEGPNDLKFTFTLTAAQAEENIGPLVDAAMKSVRIK